MISISSVALIEYRNNFCYTLVEEWFANCIVVRVIFVIITKHNIIISAKSFVRFTVHQVKLIPNIEDLAFFIRHDIGGIPTGTILEK